MRILPADVTQRLLAGAAGEGGASGEQGRGGVQIVWKQYGEIRERSDWEYIQRQVVEDMDRQSRWS